MYRRIATACVALTCILTVLPLSIGAVSAEIDERAEDTWGVYDSVLSGTLSDRIDSEVMAIEQIGNAVYIGGKFTEVRETKNSPGISRPFLAAFDATTGDYLASFDPNLDGPVYALQASPDGSRLFVGGEFGDVDGVANTKALVALDPTTGVVDTSWRSRLKREGRAVVFSLDLDETWLYVGGGFSSVGGSGGVPEVLAARATKLRLTDAYPDTSWTPFVGGGSVWGISVSPDRNTVYLAGYFSTVNVTAGTQGFVGVDNSTAQTIRPGRLDHNNTNRPFYQDVLAANDLVFVAGMEHITWVLESSDLSVRTRHTTGEVGAFGTGGDYQDLELVGDRVYAACHCRGSHFADGDLYNIIRGLEPPNAFSRQDPIKFVAAYSATDGSYIPSFQLDISGSSGVWAVHGATDGCLWIGGDLTRSTRANGTNQARGGFSKHCDDSFQADTTRPSVPTGVQLSSDGDDVQLSWTASTDDVGVVGYEIYRSADGGPVELVVTEPSTSYTDTDLAEGDYVYYLRAIDAAGNQSWRTGNKPITVSDGVIDTERPSTVQGMTVAVAANGSDVDLAWNGANDNVGVTAYRIYRATSADGSGALVGEVAGTDFTDADPGDGTYWYWVRAVDGAGNEGWRNAKRSVTVTGEAVDTERPTTPRGLQVGAVGATTVDLTWQASTDNVGVVAYQVFNAATGQIIATSSGPTVTVSGLDSGTAVTLYVRADDAAGNRSWRSNQVTVTTD